MKTKPIFPRVLLLIGAGVVGGLVPFSLEAQTASPPTDLVILLDVSGSMRSSGILPEVKRYLEQDVAGTLLKPGDRCTLILFGTTTRALPTRTLSAEADREALCRNLAELQADDDYTDLGAALEGLEAAIAARRDGSYKPMALFITDGKNAPPPSSPYAGKDLSVDAHFKEIGRKISMKGWQLYVVELGSKTDAPAVAAAVPGSTLVAPAEALSPQPLAAYAAEVEAATQDRAAAAGQNSGVAPAPAGSPRGLVFYLIGAGAAAAAAVVAVVLLGRRKKKQEEEPAPQAPK
jgi:hypothetical protein